MTIHIPQMLDTLVHIGAGGGSDNRLYQHAQHLVLVEPSPEFITTLRQAHQTHNNTRLCQLAIADIDGSTHFHLYNWRQASSLYQASGLVQLMPGLKLQETIEVQTRTLASLLTDVPMVEKGNHLLIIDAPGAEQLVVEQLAQLDQRNPFAHVLIYCPGEPHYSSNSNSTDALNRLYQQGYELIARDNSDPDRPAYSLYRNTLKQELKAAIAALSEMQKDRVKLQQKLTEQTHQLTSADNTIAELQQQLVISNKVNHELKETFPAIQSEHKKQLASLQHRLAAAEHSNSELLQQLARAEQANAEWQQALVRDRADAEKQRAGLQQRLDVAEHSNSELVQQLARAEQANAEWQQALARDRADAEKQRADLQQRLDAADHTNDTLVQQLAAARQDSNTARNERDSAGTECDALRRALARREKESVSHQDMQQLIEHNRQIANLIEDKAQRIVAEQARETAQSLAGLKSHISSGLANTTKQIECFIGIQNYLEKGSQPLSFHGWPISPDLGLYLAGLIDANDYDCIIEFGSGTSTLLMAKALRIKQQKPPAKKRNKKSKTKDRSYKTEQPYSTSSPKIVSFEHDRLYHDKTTSMLADNSVEHMVELVHAPLVDYRYKDDQHFLYYNCQDKLNELAARLKGRKANILVLVDGPPGSTNKNARFPALPYLIQSLPGHRLTLVMDDYNRQEEKEVLASWTKIAADASLEIEVEINHNEKGSVTFSITQ